MHRLTDRDNQKKMDRQTDGQTDRQTDRQTIVEDGRRAAIMKACG